MAIIGTFGLNLHKRLGVPPVSVKATTAFTSGKVKQIWLTLIPIASLTVDCEEAMALSNLSS